MPLRHSLLASAALCLVLAGCAYDEEKYGKRYNDPAYTKWKTKGASAAGASRRTHHTLVDTAAEGYSYDSYSEDNRACNAIASKRSVGSAAADGATGGLVAGVLLGGVVGAAYDDPGYGAAYGAALGTTSGALQGAADGVQRHDNIVRECMRGRGYRVLD